MATAILDPVECLAETTRHHQHTAEAEADGAEAIAGLHEADTTTASSAQIELTRDLLRLSAEQYTRVMTEIVSITIRMWKEYVIPRLRDGTVTEQCDTLRTALATAEVGLAVLAANRRQWAAAARMGVPADVTAQLASLEASLDKMKGEASRAVQARTELFVPRDPERYAEAMRPDREPTWVPADEAIARFRRGRA